MGGRRVTTHDVITEDGAQLVLTRLSAQGALRATALLVHGTYANRSFWISPKGEGLGPYLADHGVDTWLLELRGHGLSPKGTGYRHITAEQHVRFDLPAAVAYVRQQNAARPFVVGHSAGGLYTLASLAMGWLTERDLSGVVTFGSQIALGDDYLQRPAVRAAIEAGLRLLGRLPARRLGLGPEDEPAAAMLEFIRWKTRAFCTSDGRSYAEGLAQVRVPLLAFGADGDKNDPLEGCRALFQAVGSADKTFVALGKRHGLAHDYDHAGMVVSKPARAEVWPRVRDWLLHPSRAAA